jgi:hypothetical protein
MITKEANVTTVLLLDDGFAPEATVEVWLKNRGFVVWSAPDVYDLIEVLSDFTVRVCPDIVVLKVPVMTQSLKMLTDALEMAGSGHELSVWAVKDDASTPTKQTDTVVKLDRLKLLFCAESASLPSTRSKTAKNGSQ